MMGSRDKSGAVRQVRSPVPHWAPYLFVAPYVIIVIAFLGYPFLQSIRLAFFQTAGTQSQVWVGWDNFRFLAQDIDFHKALRNTVTFAFFGTVLMIPLSLGLALLLNAGKDRLKSVFRLVFFAPNVVGQIFVGIIFAVVFTPRYGIFNRFTHDIIGWGLENRWIENPGLVMPAIVITNLWLYAGFNMIYFLAALQNVDESLQEAARIDGAGPWGVFWHVTLPQIKPVAVFVLIMSTIGSFQLFELPYALMRGNTQPNGPADSALFLVSYLYDSAYRFSDLGLASAAGWVLALIILTVSLIQLKVTGAMND